jgi:16S rRNA (guanine(966)-N(2))-methyltransferase RsmD
MRIISGKKKGGVITFNDKLPVRPTTDKAKEGIFNILNNRYYFNNKNVLDLFSGTGSISFEFASRGCENVTAIDNHSKCVNHIKKNSEKFNLNINTECCDAIKYLNKNTLKFNFIFVDPPYNYKYYQTIKNIIFDKKIIKKNGCLIIEHDKNTSFQAENLELKKYGISCFSIFSF